MSLPFKLASNSLLLKNLIFNNTKSFNNNAKQFSTILRSNKTILNNSHIKPFTRIRKESTASTTKKTINVFFVDRDGDKVQAKAKVGTNLLDVAIDNQIDLEGACEGTLSCSTCHLILRKEDYAQVKPPSDEENDMLDLAFGLTETSRLGCQIVVSDKMEGWVFVVPKEVADARS